MDMLYAWELDKLMLNGWMLYYAADSKPAAIFNPIYIYI